MARVQLFGDPIKAGVWIGWAKNRLLGIKGQVPFSSLNVWKKNYKIKDVLIEIMHSPGGDKIRIWAEEEGVFIFVCHVGGDTGINGYTKKFYKLQGSELIEVEAILTDRTFSVEGLSLIDDGKYFLNYDLTTYDDPDSYDYNFNPTGLVAEDGSGTAIKKIEGKTGRFALNQSFEEEFFRGFVTDVDGTDRSYLVLDDSPTFRPYKIKGNPVFNRYTDDSITYLHSRTTHTPPSLVLRNDMYNAGIAEGFGDSLFVINKIYDKKLIDESKTEKTVNSDTNGTALFGATRFYRNKQTDQDIGRVKTFFGGVDFAEPAVKEEYGAGVTEETFHRIADETTNGYYMKGDIVYGSLKDPGGHIKMPPNFPHLDNDVKLPYTFTDEDKLTYVRMEKDDDFTKLNTGLYAADQLIEESGWEDILVLADGTGGVADSTTGKWIAENNGPIVVKKTVYTILHAHHDDNFDAVLYKKTVYKNDSSELLPYRQTNILGDQLDSVTGQIRKTLIECESSYYIAVNGIITDLRYSYTAKEYTMTAQTVADGDGGHPTIYTFQDLPWVDIDDSSINRQITRIFTTATKNSLLFGFDVWYAKSKHDVVYDESNPSYRYLWSDYDTGFTAYPPLVDLEDPQERKWFMFDAAGIPEEISTPQDNGVDYKRVNGLLMVEVR